MADEVLEVPQTVLAEILGITTRQIRNLDKQGLPGSRPAPDGRGRLYDPTISVPWYIQRERERLHNDEKDLAQIEIHKAKAAMAQLELAEREKRLMPVELHEVLLGDVLAEVRSRLRNIPGGVAPMLLGLDEEHEVVAVLTPAVDRALESAMAIADELEEEADAA